MARQRQVQEAILRQMDPANVLLKFQGIAQAGSQVVSTGIPQSMLGYFVELGTKTKDLPLTKVGFVRRPSTTSRTPTSPSFRPASTRRSCRTRLRRPIPPIPRVE